MSSSDLFFDFLFGWSCSAGAAASITAGAAAAKADRSARKAFTFSVNEKKYFASTASVKTSLYPLMMEWGTEATVG